MMSKREVKIVEKVGVKGRAWQRSTRWAGVVSLIGVLAACAYADPNTTYPDIENRKATGSSYKSRYDKYGSVFGDKGISPFNNDDAAAGSGSGIDVNGYLWRASLDTVSFMPLASADPFGGVIITDWFTPPETQDERFKINVFILGRQLRADGVRAAVFRQKLSEEGTWVDTEVDQQTVLDFENAILARARQLRIASLQ